MLNNNFGLHLILDLSECNTARINNIDTIYNFLLNLPKTMNMTLMTLPYVVKWMDKGAKTEGISGFVMIAESHISIHTYPDDKRIYADVFSCRNFHVRRTIDWFLRTFEAKKYEKQIMKR